MCENRQSLKYLSTLTSFKTFIECFYVQRYNLSHINNLIVSSIKVAIAHHQHTTIYFFMRDYNIT